MDEKVFTLLEKLNKNIEEFKDHFSQQNDRIKELEKCVKNNSAENNRGRSHEAELVQNRQSKNENFINQMRADIENVDYNENDLKGAKKKVKKAASFQERRTQRSLKERRSIHTVPSDKDEERRLKSFRRECLSGAIKWNIVDLVKALPDQQTIHMPKWLSRAEIRSIEQGTDQKNCFRRFLYVLIDKDFDTMQEWLNSCSLDEKVILQVSRTYEEFSDVETNRFRMKCFHCKLVETVNVQDVCDYLFSAEIISRQLYLRIISSALIVGAQEGLWKDILEECRKHIYPKALVSAFKIAFTDKTSMQTGSEKDSHESLLNVIDDVDASDILDCHCKERCSKSFHPFTCLKSMSLAGVYFSPPISRKKASSSESGSPQSNLSSYDDDIKVDSENPPHDLSSDSDETVLKKPDIPPRVPIANPRQDKTLRKVPNRSQKMLQRTSKQKDMVHCDETSSDSFDGDCKPPAIPARQSNKRVTNMSSNRQENNPNVIRAVNVYFNTGPKYNIIKRGISESSSEQ
ncbi:uncharacterized protein LOC132759213 [Ruditapes philippinarum]|uniref:uncharacterized protein LOC132759213 n=1 Tax=Ruditapes philippinarum TaxID=129788 RepID=UPI00295BEFF8|nr:uncharacterized protein LOC132759213 [Ruditapes philippinarum]